LQTVLNKFERCRVAGVKLIGRQYRKLLSFLCSCRLPWFCASNKRYLHKIVEVRSSSQAALLIIITLHGVKRKNLVL